MKRTLCRIRGTVALLAAAAAAGVVDRVAVVVGTDVVTETEVLREVRLTQFQNGEPLELSPMARRAAAERLVDQILIRREMTIGGYRLPTDAEAAAMLRKFRQERFTSVSDFRAALDRYGISEAELRERLREQLAAIRFTDTRFHAGLPAAPPADGAERLAEGSAAQPESGTVDQQMESWLREARSRVRVQFKKEAFQ
jgi:hypothetical protein